MNTSHNKPIEVTIKPPGKDDQGPRIILESQRRSPRPMAEADTTYEREIPNLMESIHNA